MASNHHHHHHQSHRLGLGNNGSGGSSGTRSNHHHRQPQSSVSKNSNDRTSSSHGSRRHHQQQRHCPLPSTGGVSLATVTSQLDSVSHTLLSRRPLLHIVVLFAADMRMRRFAYDVQERFLKGGVNVFMQMETLPRQFIKPEHLQEIITDSTADCLIVLGDKNMKNNTCHAKKSGKLTEVPVEERVQNIMAEWKQGANFSKVNKLLNQEVDKLTDHQLYELIELFASIRHIDNRLERLGTNVHELKDWAFPKTGTRSGFINESSHDRIGLGDEKMLARLTTTQNTAIRLHRDLSKAIDIVDAIPVDDSNGGNLRRGLQLSSIDRESQIGVGHEFKSRLINACKDVLFRIETLGGELSELANNSSLWDAYMQDKETGQSSMTQTQPQKQEWRRVEEQTIQQKISSARSEKTNVSKEMWSCRKCTFDNKLDSTVCEVCGDNFSHEEGAGWKATGKKSHRRKMPSAAANNQRKNIIASAKLETRSKPKAQSLQSRQPTKVEEQDKLTQVPGPHQRASTTQPLIVGSAQSFQPWNTIAVPAITGTQTLQQQQQQQQQADFKSPMMQTLFGYSGTPGVYGQDSPRSSSTSSSGEYLQFIESSAEASPQQRHQHHHFYQFHQQDYLHQGYETAHPSWQFVQEHQQRYDQRVGQLVPSMDDYPSLNSARSRSNSGGNSSRRQTKQTSLPSTAGTDTQGPPYSYSQVVDGRLNDSTDTNTADGRKTAVHRITQHMSAMKFGDDMGPNFDSVGNSPRLSGGFPQAEENGVGFFNSGSQSFSQHSAPFSSQESSFYDSPLFPSQESPSTDHIWGGGDMGVFQKQRNTPAIFNNPLTAPGFPQDPQFAHDQWKLQQQQQQHQQGRDDSGPGAAANAFHFREESQFQQQQQQPYQGSEISSSALLPLPSRKPGSWKQGHLAQERQQQQQHIFHRHTAHHSHATADYGVNSSIAPSASFDVYNNVSQFHAAESSRATNGAGSTSRTNLAAPVVKQPCMVCGRESMFECNVCANLRRKGISTLSAYFCSPEHQQAAFAHHQRYHMEHHHF